MNKFNNFLLMCFIMLMFISSCQSPASREPIDVDVENVPPIDPDTISPLPVAPDQTAVDKESVIIDTTMQGRVVDPYKQ